MSRSGIRRRSPVALLFAALWLQGCGATTGVDVEVIGGNTLGGDQVRVEGGVEGMTVHSSTLPTPPRALGRIEDVRVVVPDSLAGKTIAITASVLKAGQPVGTPPAMVGLGILVERKTKRIILCFDPAGCP